MSHVEPYILQLDTMIHPRTIPKEINTQPPPPPRPPLPRNIPTLPHCTNIQNIIEPFQRLQLYQTIFGIFTWALV